MAEEFPPEFKFNGDEQEPETFYNEELKDLRVEKLSQRVTLLTILLPCLLGVAVYFGYRDLSGRVSQGYDSESLAVQRLTSQIENLSKDFNDKLITFSTTLSTQDKDLGNTVEGRLSTIGKNVDELQKNFASLTEDLKRTGETIERLNASKADKKSQALEIEKINAAITPLKADLDKLKTIDRDLKTVSNDISNLESKLTKQLATVAANTEQNKKDYEQIQDSLTKLTGKTVDKDTLALEIIKLRNYFQSQIAKEVSDLNRRVDSLKKEIEGIEKISKSQKQPLNKISKKTSPPQPATVDNTGAAGQPTASPSGTIVEKDLVE
jgi:chromosome segregation ATPase